MNRKRRLSTLLAFLIVFGLCSQNSYAQNVDENLINYIYVEYPYIESGMKQSIVVSTKKQSVDFQNVSLMVSNENGVNETWKCEKNIDNLYLFTREFADEKEKNTYTVSSIVIDGKEIQLNEIADLAQFGVNKMYDGYGSNLYSMTFSEEVIDTTVVTVNAVGEIQSKNTIEEALAEVGATQMNPKLRTNETIIVALDPGHDSRHAGATANGLLEHELTFKIANYCKQELEKYDNVAVYMTRTGETCPYPETTTAGKCIEQRAIAAAQNGAKIYVSMHLNAEKNGTTANGAEIIFPNNNWKEEVGKEGEKLAQSIQEELVKLGLNDRGIYIKNSTIGEIYDDGSRSDYFAVQIYNKQNGVPGIIIEHVFITNESDVNTFLKTEEGLKSLGVADANGIINYLGLEEKEETDDNNEYGKIIEDGFYYIETSTNSKFVNGNDKIQLGNKRNTLNQIYKFQYVENGNYLIQNVQNKMYLTSGNLQNGTSADIFQKELANSKFQMWKIRRNADETLSIMNSKTGLMLDVCYGNIVEGENIQTYTDNGTNAQKFYLKNARSIAEGIYEIVSLADKSYALDIASASVEDGANLQLYTRNQTDAQKFMVKYNEGYYTIQNLKSGKVFDVKHGDMSSGANVWQYSNNNSDAQKWTIIQQKDGGYVISNAISGLVLAVQNNSLYDGANIQTSQSSGLIEQRFSFVKDDEGFNGKFYIKSFIDSSYAVDISCASMENQANTQLYEMNGTLAQQFYIEYKDDGYVIRNVKSNKVLDVAYAGMSSGTNVWQYEENGTLAQKWDIVKNAGGSYTFISKLNGLALDVTSAACKNESNIQVYESNGTNAQKFILEKI